MPVSYTHLDVYKRQQVLRSVMEEFVTQMKPLEQKYHLEREQNIGWYGYEAQVDTFYDHAYTLSLIHIYPLYFEGRFCRRGSDTAACESSEPEQPEGRDPGRTGILYGLTLIHI